MDYDFGKTPGASTLHSSQDDDRLRCSDAVLGDTHKDHICKVQALRH